MSAATVLTVSCADAAAAVPEVEFKRLLGIPRGREVPDQVAAGADAARDWYAARGRPFVAARRVELRRIDADSVSLQGGDVLEGSTLAEHLRIGEAHAIVVAAVSAGPEVAAEAARLWADGRPDESYFLDRFAAAVAEQLVWRLSAVLCADATSVDEGLMPHLSPGCGRWGLSAQHALMALLLGRPVVADSAVATAAATVECGLHEAEASGGASSAVMTLGPLSLLDTGALRPQHSFLAALGVTRRAIVTTPESSCRSCDLRHCRYRRAAYARGEAGRR